MSKENLNITDPNLLNQSNIDTSLLYEIAYPKASKFMKNADEKLQKIIDKLSNDELGTLRDRFVDFYVSSQLDTIIKQ